MHETKVELARLAGEMAKVSAVCPESRKLLQQHHRSLYGANGEPGAIAAIHRWKEDQAERDKVRTGVFAAFAGLLPVISAAVSKLAGL